MKGVISQILAHTYWSPVAIRPATLGLAVAACLGACTQKASEPTFRAVAEAGSVTMFSTTDASRRCSASVQLTYLKNGTREPVGFDCVDYLLTVGKDQVMCKAQNPDLVEPRIEGEIRATCQPPQAETK